MTEYWFRPKARGIGAGVPLNWKGWALFGGYLAAIIAVPTAWQVIDGHEGSILERLISIAIISGPFLYVARKKTAGGWHWRNGEGAADEHCRSDG
jgi:hypothetical protein